MSDKYFKLKPRAYIARGSQMFTPHQQLLLVVRSLYIFLR